MDKEFEYKGIWWIPENPNMRLQGTLEYTPNREAILNLIGFFGKKGEEDKLLRPEIILGKTEKRKITLHQCLELRRNIWPHEAYVDSTFWIGKIFIGAHYQKPSEIVFKAISIQYSHFDEWLDRGGIEVQHDPNDYATFIYKCKPPKPIEIMINEKIKLVIRFKSSPVFCVPGFKLSEISITQNAFIAIEFSELKSFEELLYFIYYLQILLSLACLEPIVPLCLKGSAEIIKDSSKKMNEVEIFYASSFAPNLAKKLSLHKVYFDFDSIAHRFENFMQNWFKKLSILEPIYDLYFMNIYHRGKNLKYEFLGFIQAIESYHRRTMKNYELEEPEYKKRIEEILAAVPSKYQNWLQYKMKYRNEPSLPMRLKEIIEKSGIIADSFIKDKDSFIKSVTDSRNYFTHYDFDLKEKAADEDQLYHLTQKLKILLEIILLSELEFSLTEIQHSIVRNNYYLAEVDEKQKA